MDVQLLELNANDIRFHIDKLNRILVDSVDSGAAISFMSPLPDEVAEGFWINDVLPEVANQRRILLGAMYNQELVGTVQIITAMTPNQQHRCEIAKMIVHPEARRMGIGRSLMNKAIHRAAELGKSLITLDTRTGDAAEPLYAAVGFETAGIIPDYAWNPDGRERHAATYMFRRIC